MSRTMKAMKAFVYCLSMLAFLMNNENHCQADHLSLDFTGSFDATTTLGGVPLGADTPYTYHAVFDPSVNFESFGGGLFATTVTFDIAGQGTFVSAAGANLGVALGGPSPIAPGGYFAGIVNSTDPHSLTRGLAGLFGATSNPAFDPANPSPTVYSQLIYDLSPLPFDIPLVGGIDLVINAVGSAPETAQISAVAPEPTSIVIFGIGAASFGCLTVLRKGRRIGLT